MNDRWKEEYAQIPIPSELDSAVDAAIQKGRRHRRRRAWTGFLTPLAACAAFVLMLNVNAAFAYAVYDIPVLGDLGRIFTFREYREETDTFIADVKIPNVDLSGLEGNAAWAEAINETITETMEKSVAESMDRAEEYYEAYVETGGDPEEFHQILIDVDYEVKYSSQNILSFVIYKCETLATGYQENYYYNIDLQTGEEITLEEILGPRWAEIVAEQVEEQLAQFPEEDKEMLFTDYLEIRDVVENREGSYYHIGFYLDEAGSPVVVFPKYTLGAGALGLLEFPITVPTGNA